LLEEAVQNCDLPLQVITRDGALHIRSLLLLTQWPTRQTNVPAVVATVRHNYAMVAKGFLIAAMKHRVLFKVVTDRQGRAHMYSMVFS